jgi:hypothetical protein
LVVVDGSTDGSERPVLAMAQTEPALSVHVLPRNSGKGAAVLAGGELARARGFTHALVMDADGQHPAASIAEFMAVSQRQPAALVLGQPVFPANIPPERLHGRKLSVGLVHFELLSKGVADPLFGFRVYPLAALAAALGTRRSGRRYDFDTEAAVRMGWAGVPLVNVPAPVRYFSREEGGISHFRYGRDNVRLVWMHTRLITELLVLRWPAAWRARRMLARVSPALLAFVLLAGAGAAHPARGQGATALEEEPLVNAAHRIEADASAWQDLVDVFAHKPDTLARFTERRYFPFKNVPVTLTGEVRVSATRGLSLHYETPDERTVILDAQGMLMRAAAGEKAPPADPRAAVANEALRHILRFDFAALQKKFELFGERDGSRWVLALVPRSATLRRGLGRITVAGEGATVSSIEIRRAAKQYIQIQMEPPQPARAFTEDEVKRFFR